MTGDKSKFVELQLKKNGTVTFGDNRSCDIIGKGTIGNGKVNICNVHLVKGLEFNLISISQLMDNGHQVNFNKKNCIISHGTNNSTLVAKREGNIYTIDFERQEKELCLTSIQDEANL